MRRITLICGPPCSGKTTLARRLARPGDIVLDFDDIAIRLGSTRRWRHDPQIAAEAEYAMQLAMRSLAHTETVTAYVIRSLPDPARRAHLARAIRADAVHVLAPPMAEVLRRAVRDGRPAGTTTTIRQWYRHYRPHPLDSPCPTPHLVPARTLAAEASPAPAHDIRGGSGTARTAPRPPSAATTPAGKR